MVRLFVVLFGCLLVHLFIPQVHAQTSYTTFPNTVCQSNQQIVFKPFNTLPLSEWWGPNRPPNSYDAYATRVWQGNVQELVYANGYVYVRTGEGLEAHTLIGKPWTSTPLTAVWGSVQNPPPTIGISSVAYRVHNGKLSELIVAGSTIYYREANSPGSYSFPAVFQTQSLAQTWGNTTNPPPFTGIDELTYRVVNGLVQELVVANGTIYVRSGTTADTNSLATTWSVNTLANIWANTPNPPTTSPSNLQFQENSGVLRELFTLNGQVHYRDCQSYPTCTTSQTNDPFHACYYRRSYATMQPALPSTNAIQQFSGSSLLAEFDESPHLTTQTPRFYAGHLGEIWSPPFFSTHSYNNETKPDDQQKSFNTGLVLFDPATNFGTYETPLNPQTQAFWHPSKLTNATDYTTLSTPITVRTAKTSLPNHTFALKTTLTNNGPNPTTQKLLFTINAYSLGFFSGSQLLNGSPGWGWFGKNSNVLFGANARGSYNSANQAVVFTAPSLGNVYLAVGLDRVSNSTLQWTVTDTISGDPYFASVFKTNGLLSNANHETAAEGAAAGLATTVSNFGSGQSRTATLYASFGTTEAEAITRLNYIRSTHDPEDLADREWAKRFESTKALPRFQSANSTLTKLYYNSALAYLMSKWDYLNSLGQSTFYTLSLAYFPWTIGTTNALINTDPAFMRQYIKQLLTMDFTKCKGFSALDRTPTNEYDLCDTDYSYTTYSMINLIHQYLATYGDSSFLNEVVESKTILTHAETMANFYENRNNPTTNLVDFGHDSQLYEFNLPVNYCPNFGGNYTGYVVSPNTERALAFDQLSQLFAFTGNSTKAAQYTQKAQSVRAGLQTLWNPSASWFNTISLYDTNKTLRSTPVTNQYPFIAVFHALDLPNFLSPTQINALMGKVNNFINSNTQKFTSLDKTVPWCVRTDWHGPGLYSGEIGAMLTRMYQNGQKDLATSMLTTPGKGYSYFADIPISCQASHHESPVCNIGNIGAAYIEGNTFSQTITNGLFGITQGLTSSLSLSPRLPNSSIYPVSLKRVRSQAWSLDIEAASNSQIKLIFTKASATNQLTFTYSPDGSGHNLDLTVNNLTANATYYIISQPFNGSPRTTLTITTNASGVLSHQISLNQNSQISIGQGTLPTPLPTPISSSTTTHTPTHTQTPIPGDLNGDRKVTKDDLLLAIGENNIFTYNTVVAHYGN